MLVQRPAIGGPLHFAGSADAPTEKFQPLFFFAATKSISPNFG
jgi:hypothetical protein